MLYEVITAGVHHYAWIGPVDMANGLALAESTPGPLILVTQFSISSRIRSLSAMSPSMRLLGRRIEPRHPP